MQKKFPIHVLLISIGLLVGCNNSETLHIFQDNNCQLPCWFQIIPGKSNASDVKQLISQIPFVDKNSISWLGNWNLFSEQVTWKFSNNIQTGDIYFIQNIVQSIVLQNQLDLSLEQALLIFGQPEEITFSKPVLLYKYGSIIRVNLLYPSKGISLFLPFPSNKEITLGENSSIDSIIITNPEQFFQNLSTVFIDKEDFKQRLYPWDGYKTYKVNHLEK